MVRRALLSLVPIALAALALLPGTLAHGPANLMPKQPVSLYRRPPAFCRRRWFAAVSPKTSPTLRSVRTTTKTTIALIVPVAVAVLSRKSAFERRVFKQAIAPGPTTGPASPLPEHPQPSEPGSLLLPNGQQRGRACKTARLAGAVRPVEIGAFRLRAGTFHGVGLTGLPQHRGAKSIAPPLPRPTRVRRPADRSEVSMTNQDETETNNNENRNMWIAVGVIVVLLVGGMGISTLVHHGACDPGRRSIERFIELVAPLFSHQWDRGPDLQMLLGVSTTARGLALHVLRRGACSGFSAVRSRLRVG